MGPDPPQHPQKTERGVGELHVEAQAVEEPVVVAMLLALKVLEVIKVELHLATLAVEAVVELVKMEKLLAYV